MITNFFIPELNNHDVQELWFQQDGATCHTARATIDLLKDTFGDRLISHFGPVNWPPRSCDLTPLDYFLWGYVKSLVYAAEPQTPDYLEDNIRRVIADIRPQMLEKVIENWTSRLDYIRVSRGSPMPSCFQVSRISSSMWRTRMCIVLLMIISFILITEQANYDSSRSHAIHKNFVWECYYDNGKRQNGRIGIVNKSGHGILRAGSSETEKIELREDLKSRRGLAVSLEIICHNCGESRRAQCHQKYQINVMMLT
ncbi:putative LOC100569746 [Trichonephila clavipes]|nr:putative LOC100569746 [Trichonephila clavipes]